MKLKKLLCLVLSLAMILGAMGTTAFASGAEADVWDGTVDTSWYDPANPQTEYTLTTAEQFAGLAFLVNGAQSYNPALGNEDTADFGYYSGKNAVVITAPNTVNFDGVIIKLAADLDLCAVYASGDPVELPGGEQLSMVPVGYSKTTPFKGTFDGQGHTIKNMFQGGWDLYGMPNSFSGLGLGLFGYVENATIKNLVLDNYLSQGEINVGGIAAMAYGTSTFEDITLKDCTVAGGGGWRVGGIVGWGYGNLTFDGIDIDESNIISQSPHYDTSVGGIVGGSNNVDGESFTFRNCDIACVLDVFNDAIANHDTNSYRNCGMIIGGVGEDNEDIIDGVKYPNFANKGLTFEDVTVTFGEWANYTYCWSYELPKNCQRLEAGHGYAGVDLSTLSDYSLDSSRPFDAVFGAENAGDLSNVRGPVNAKMIRFLGITGITITDKAKDARSVAEVWTLDTAAPADEDAEANWIYVDSYVTLEEAISAANEGDMVKLTKDITLDATVTVAKNIIIDGNGFTISTVDTPADDEDGIVAIAINNAEVTINNATIIGGAYTGTKWGVGGDAVYAENATLNVNNSTIIGGDTASGDIIGSGSAITSIDSTIVVAGSELKTPEVGTFLAAPLINADTASKLTISDTTLDYQTYDGIGTLPMISTKTPVGGYEALTTPVTMSGNIVIAGSALYDISIDAVPENERLIIIGEIVKDRITLHPDFEYDRAGNGVAVVPKTESADSLSIEYKDITAADAEESKTYEIVVKANGDDVINELASVDLTFAFTKTPVGAGAMSFTVLPASDFTLSQTGNEGEENRYMFNYNGSPAFEGTGNEIVIGTITVDGFGSYTIATADVATNIVNATTVNDNLVEYYTATGATDDDESTGELVINDDTVADDGLVGEITDGEITIPTRELTINIDFPNVVTDNTAAYQDMTVTIVGGTTDKEIKLGTDVVMNAEGAYVIAEELAYNTTYTVTVEGAGYRTARYSVVLTEDKELNFWNNVMDNAIEVEEGKATSAVTKNFLAGDIVKDNNINIYDLSAVVSYFGTEDLSAENHPEYAKYDLNRDGVIDSKDVAYVLVSWNE